MSRVTYSGDYTYNFFPTEKDNLNNVITNWQKQYPELCDELEYWKYSREGIKFTHKQTVFPLQRGRKIKCGFLKIYESGENNNFYCISIIGDISIKAKSIMDRTFGWMGFRESCTDMIKSCPKIMAALIMSGGSGLRIKWEED